MKLLHTSDLRIGAAFPHAPDQAEALRDARLEAVRSVLAVAVREKVGGIVLAGNSLASNHVALREALDLAALLATSPVPVYLVPGELDPLTEESPYRRKDTWRTPVEITAASPVDLPARAAEPFGWGQESGLVSIVEGSTVRTVATGRFSWLDWERVQPDVVSLQAELKALAAESTLLRLTLRGELAAAQWLELHDMLARQRLYLLEVRDLLTLTPAQVYHHPLLRGVESELLSTAGQPIAEGEVPGEAEVARHALGTLARVLSGGGKEDLI